jgi:phage FluMu gp28-like protein
VFVVIEAAGDMRLVRKMVTMQNEPFAEQERRLYELLALPTMRRACIDNTGIGRQFVERAAAKFGAYKVEGINFTGPVKEQLAYPLRSAFEDKIIRVPDERPVIADLRAIKKETTAAGNVRFAADRGPGGHADRFWAVGCALEAAKSPAMSYTAELV